MLQPVRRITNVNATLQRGVAGADSLFAVMDEEDEDDSGTLEVARVRGDVDFRRVHFPMATKAAVHRQCQRTIAAGKTLAIVGHSGSGKSTLVSLLPRFYELDSGEHS